MSGARGRREPGWKAVAGVEAADSTMNTTSGVFIRTVEIERSTSGAEFVR